ncbi:MAG: NrtA/SsuA/CpmA family ABC transporter substrate-binding protein [Chloroflexi bacterium]|nr:NrtA/SsuA/CpmA family ABC transporter substrate-binding protein [Chloroflexota bacterium]
MLTFRLRRILLVSLCVISIVVTSCAEGSAPAQAPATQAVGTSTSATPKEAKQESKPEPKQEALKPIKIKFAYNSVSGNSSILYLAKEAGLFDKHGLDVEMSYIASSTTSIEALLSGDIPILQGGGQAAVNAAIAGGDVVNIIGIINTFGFAILSKPEIKSIAELKGKRIGVTKKGASTDFAARFTLRKNGIDPDKDASILAIGGVPEELAALKSGALDAAVLSPPTSIRAKQEGYRELIDLSKTDDAYLQTSVATTRKFIKSNPEAVRRFVKAYIEATSLYGKDKDLMIKALAKYTKVDDKAALEDTYDMYKNTFARAPYVKVDAVKTVLEEIGMTNEKAKSADPNAFFDNSFVKEFDDSGFIRSLYDK